MYIYIHIYTYATCEEKSTKETYQTKLRKRPTEKTYFLFIMIKTYSVETERKINLSKETHIREKRRMQKSTSEIYLLLTILYQF